MSPEPKNDKSTDPVNPVLEVTQPEVVQAEVAPAPVEVTPIVAPEVTPAVEYPTGLIVGTVPAEADFEPNLAFDDYLLLSNLSAFEAGMLGRTSGKYARPFSAWHAAKVAVIGG